MAVTRLPKEKEKKINVIGLYYIYDLNDLYKHTCAIMITIVRLQDIMCIGVRNYGYDLCAHSIVLHSPLSHEIFTSVLIKITIKYKIKYPILNYKPIKQTYNSIHS